MFEIRRQILHRPEYAEAPRANGGFVMTQADNPGHSDQCIVGVHVSYVTEKTANTTAPRLLTRLV